MVYGFAASSQIERQTSHQRKPNLLPSIGTSVITSLGKVTIGELLVLASGNLMVFQREEY